MLCLWLYFLSVDEPEFKPKTPVHMLLPIPLHSFFVGQAICRQSGMLKYIENSGFNLKFFYSIWRKHAWQRAMLGPFLPDVKGIEQLM